MTDTAPVITPETASRAAQTLLPVIFDLSEAVANLASRPDVAGQADRLATLCRDVAQVADTLALITRRARR